MNTKNYFKALGLAFFKALGSVTIALGVLGTPALAGNTQDIQDRLFAQNPNSTQRMGAGATVVAAIAGSTTTTSMNLQYTGTAANAYVRIGASSITFEAPIGTPDTTIGTAQYGATGQGFDLTASTVTNMGQLCDVINGVGSFALNGNANGGAPTGGNWHCTLTDAIRSDLTQSNGILPNIAPAAGINNAAAVGGFNVPFGTSTIISLGILPAKGKDVVLNWCSASVAGTPQMTVYGVKAKHGVGGPNSGTFGETMTDANLVWTGAAIVANTVTNYPLATVVAAPWIEFSGGGTFNYKPGPNGGQVSDPAGNVYNGHVVVRFNDYNQGALGNAVTSFLTCQWSEK